ncbi:conserved hypothetical protein [Pyrenophora tritici-repentis Pt-1C-BFP]|uniref:Uncharacterized protein n=1 Tax=Pyrenophora tritici-repentis (strain Pt-1C-BFP) TaxID=426418 RepID=B2VXJ4_PYRTR|nr:uncharacterized protein PTRG_03240 [Pyrenophora tritici-repentis Pt-1C-BFP]EDU45763.1 conserved hypothetical protein [Pyrenophora tritici-repentis Pt-1C-BFP]
MAQNDELFRFQDLLKPDPKFRGNSDIKAAQDELRNAPFVWWPVKTYMDQNGVGPEQYAVMGCEMAEDPDEETTLLDIDEDHEEQQEEPDLVPVLLNTNSPWSAFLCGSQGSGKSHALSCILEGCLMNDPDIGRNSAPLAGIVFHYDRAQGGDVCEAAYLCGKIRTKVLVSASHIGPLTERYEAIAQRCGAKITVVKRILREMAINKRGVNDFNYRDFLAGLQNAGLSEMQSGPLEQRLDLLEAFVDIKPRDKTVKIKGKPTVLATKRNKNRTKARVDLFSSDPGSLTIVDLTDPHVDEESVCALFDICLAIFISQTTCGKIIALDEAHNYMGEDNAATANFTERLLKSIREQRHQGARVVIATQEPSINTRLLDLCNVTMVHRCASQAWYDILKQHLAALKGEDHQRVFEKIVRLKTGECLLFCPTAAVGIDERKGKIKRMDTDYCKFLTRRRITADGGKSKLADGSHVE